LPLCANCGEVTDVADRFCAACGAPANSTAPLAPPIHPLSFAAGVGGARRQVAVVLSIVIIGLVAITASRILLASSRSVFLPPISTQESYVMYALAVLIGVFGLFIPTGGKRGRPVSSRASPSTQANENLSGPYDAGSLAAVKETLLASNKIEISQLTDDRREPISISTRVDKGAEEAHDAINGVAFKEPSPMFSSLVSSKNELNGPIVHSTQPSREATGPTINVRDTYRDSFASLGTREAAKPPIAQETSIRATVQEKEETGRTSEVDQALLESPGGDVDKLRKLLRRIQELERERDQLKENLWKAKGRPSRLSAVLMLTVGAIALMTAVVYSTTVVAFIGLALIFWGALLLQIRPSGYLKADLLDPTALSPIMITDQLLSQLGYSGRGIYMRDDKQETVVFVPAADGGELPSSSQLGKTTFLESPKGVVLTPLGRSLAYFLEGELGGKTTIRELASLQARLGRLLIENLEIARDFEMNLEAGRVLIRFEDSMYATLCQELKENTRIWSTMGCPISSAMGCILTGSTQRPVAFEGESISEDGRIMEAKYRILQTGGSLPG